LYLAFFFIRSAYRKVKGYERVTAEFLQWGYPFPGQVTFFLIAVWILGSTALLIPETTGFAAVALLAFMAVAFATLVVHGEYRRLVEPSVPIVLLVIIIAIHQQELAEAFNQTVG
jgi:uncharacterized membrane protein YphA (DoxX/SURF4 family)